MEADKKDTNMSRTLFVRGGGHDKKKHGIIKGTIPIHHCFKVFA